MANSMSDAERNHSMQMNEAKAECAVKNEGGVRCPKPGTGFYDYGWSGAD